MKTTIQADSLVLEITRRCNMCCEHCLRGDAEHLDISDEILDYVARNIQCYSVTFTGGEPSLNVKAIERYFELAERYGNLPSSFFVATNGAENQTELAVTLLKAYEKMDEKECCSIALSTDAYHDDIGRAADILSGLSFFSPEEKKHAKNAQPTWVLPVGRAVNNGIGWATDYNKTPEDIDELVDEWEIREDSVEARIENVLYVSANGNVTGNCNMCYEDIDESPICHVFDLLKKVQEAASVECCV